MLANDARKRLRKSLHCDCSEKPDAPASTGGSICVVTSGESRQELLLKAAMSKSGRQQQSPWTDDKNDGDPGQALPGTPTGWQGRRNSFL